jgi:hypothetical protein
MCSLTTHASPLKITTVLPTTRDSLFHKKALAIPVSSPRTTLAFFPLGRGSAERTYIDVKILEPKYLSCHLQAQ